MSVPLDEVKAVRTKFDHAGVLLYAYNLSFRDDFTDSEIERGFEMARALGDEVMTSSSNISRGALLLLRKGIRCASACTTIPMAATQ